MKDAFEVIDSLYADFAGKYENMACGLTGGLDSRFSYFNVATPR